MLIGQTIACHDGEGETYYTPWFPRQGSTVVSTFEVIAIGPNVTIAVKLQTKDSEEAGDPTGSIGDATLSAVDVKSFESDGDCKELVRYQVLLTTSGSDTEECHFRILSPSWLTTGAQSI